MLEITVRHWPFSDQLSIKIHLVDQIYYCTFPVGQLSTKPTKCLIFKIQQLKKFDSYFYHCSWCSVSCWGIEIWPKLWRAVNHFQCHIPVVTNMSNVFLCIQHSQQFHKKVWCSQFWLSFIMNKDRNFCDFVIYVGMSWIS